MTRPEDFVLVRATVAVLGLRAGEYDVVDQTDPHVAALIRATYLVVEDEDDRE